MLNSIAASTLAPPMGGTSPSLVVPDLSAQLADAFARDPGAGRDMLLGAVMSGDPAQLAAIRRATAELGTLPGGSDPARVLDDLLASHGTPLQREAMLAEGQGRTVAVGGTRFGERGSISWAEWKRDHPDQHRALLARFGGDEAAAIRHVNAELAGARQGATLRQVAGGDPALAKRIDAAPDAVKSEIARAFDALPPSEKAAYRALAGEAKRDGSASASERFGAQSAAMLFRGLPSARVAAMPAAELAAELAPITSRLSNVGGKSPLNAAALLLGGAFAVAHLRPDASPMSAGPDGGGLEAFPDAAGEAGRYAQTPPTVGQDSAAPPLVTYPPLADQAPPLVTPPVSGTAPTIGLPADEPTGPDVLTMRPDWPITRPTGVKGGEPVGTPSAIEANKQSRNKLDVKEERFVAASIATDGYRVEYGERWSQSELSARGLDPSKRPDLRVEGEPVDVYTPHTSRIENIVSRINSKSDNEQTSRVAVSLRYTSVSRAELQEALRSEASPKLKEVFTVDQAGRVGRAYP